MDQGKVQAVLATTHHFKRAPTILEICKRLQTFAEFSFMVEVDASTNEAGAVLSQQQGYSHVGYPMCLLLQENGPGKTKLLQWQPGAIGHQAGIKGVAPLAQQGFDLCPISTPYTPHRLFLGLGSPWPTANPIAFSKSLLVAQYIPECSALHKESFSQPDL